MTILCTIDLETREVFLPADQRIASYDHNVDVIRFQAEPIEDFSLDTSSIKIAAQGPNKARHDYAVDPSTVQIEEETGYITFDWPIPQGVTEMPIGAGFKYGDRGQLIFAVCAEIISGSTVSKAWHSDDGIITVVAHLEPESGGGEDPEEEATNAQKIAQLQTDVAVVQRAVAAVAGGTPTVVDAKADMTDTNKIYILSTDGKWYYWDGAAWQIGGQYGGAVTSTTFNQHGVPADDFAVGQALEGLEEAISDVTAPTDEQVANAVSDWLDDHPSAVSDGVVLHVSGSGTYRTVDKTYSEILSALSAGKTVVVNDLDAIYPYVGQMSQNGGASLAFGVSAVYQQNVVLDGYLIAQVSGSTVAVRTQEYSNFYSKSEIDTMIGNIETLLSAI